MINHCMKIVTLGAFLTINAEVHQFDGTISLEELVATSSAPVVIKFFTPWCGACISMARAKVFERVSEDPLIKSRVLFVEVDFQKYQDLFKHWQIFSVPHLFFFNKGLRVADHKGALTFEGLRTKVLSLFTLTA